MTTQSVEEIVARAIAEELWGESAMFFANPLTVEKARKRMTERARAAISALTERGYFIEQGWRTIDSAPKDGTRVILAWGGSSVVGYYLDNRHTRHPWAGWKVPSMEPFPAGQPTMWRPIPAVLGGTDER